MTLTFWALVPAILAVLAHRQKVARSALGHGVTLVHEVGHALVGMLTGGKVHGIVLNAASGGVTHTAYMEKNYVLSRLLGAGAGYPAPAFFGSLTILAAVFDRPMWGWVALAVLGVLCLFFSRSLFTVFVSLVFLIPSATFLLPTSVPDHLSSHVLLFIGSVLMLGAAEGLFNLHRVTRRDRNEPTDALTIGNLFRLGARFGLAWLWGGTILAVAAPTAAVILLTR